MMSHHHLRLLAAVLLVCGSAMPARSQGERVADADLKSLSLEELMEIDVTSVSRRAESLVRAAAAVSVITGDEIRRSGANSLPDALRLANPLHVAKVNQRVWAISARGFNQSTANKLLVLIDGRSVYTPLYSGVFWDVQDVLLEDVDRLEIIRGPGATLWGANAVNGVINIITKKAADTQGGLALAGGGEEERGFGAVRWGGELGARGHYRAYGKFVDRDPLVLARSGGDPRDHMWLGQGGFRTDLKIGSGDGLTLQGDVYTGEVGEPFRGDSSVDGGNLLGRWSRALSERSGVELQVYWDRSHRFIPALFEEHRDTWDVDFQQDIRLGTRHALLWGADYRHTRDRVGNSREVAFIPSRRAQDLFSAFVQDEISFRDDRLRVAVGTKLEHHDSVGLEVLPNLRFSLALSERRVLWGAVARAVRTPTRLDEDVIFYSPVNGAEIVRGSRDFESEDLLAWELGYRVQLRPELNLDLAAFFNDYEDLRSQEFQPDGGLPIVLGNRSNAETWGFEARANWQPVAWWRLHAAYALLEEEFTLDPGSRDPTGGRAEANDPRHRLMLRSYLDLPGSVELDAWLRYVDELSFSRTPAYTELNLHLGWRPRRSLELALFGENLLHEDHVEFGAASPFQEAVQRSFYGKVTWSF
jgi:iron complex outermembrane recepter protein